MIVHRTRIHPSSLSLILFLKDISENIDIPNTWGASLVAYMVKNLPVIQETWVQSLGREVPQRKWQPTPVFTPGEFHGQKSVEGYSQQYCK